MEEILLQFDLILPEFLGITVCLFGFAAYATGKAVAGKWQPWWYCIWYAVLLGLFDRFIHYALFDGLLTSYMAYIIDTVIILIIALISYRLTKVYKMTRQYPWLYRRLFIFFWKRKTS